MQMPTVTHLRSSGIAICVLLLFAHPACADEPPARSAAYACGDDSSLIIIAADAGAIPPAGYRAAQTGPQALRCGKQVSATLNVVPPQEKGMCAGTGRVVITDISVADWPPYGRLIEFNKECFFSDFITRVTIRPAKASYSVESCSVASRTNKKARIGCTTDTTR
ncbi:hypothetical protein [Stenotrophomonas sp.]|uniref:hypothetical protein n=1 Tax=Stenotrophomonas sp. TaxID=69392 RepID=UPI0028B1A711|nr:hypothetical protein [Stenotrophomonas sp.]